MRQQSRAIDLRDMDRLREDAADVLRRATTRAGKRYDAATLLLSHFRSLAASLWRTDLPGLETATLLEAEADAAEDVAEVGALLDAERMAVHSAALERQIARSEVLLAVQRRELAARRRSA
jgi:hypothetical protein